MVLLTFGWFLVRDTVYPYRFFLYFLLESAKTLQIQD